MNARFRDVMTKRPRRAPAPAPHWTARTPGIRWAQVAAAILGFATVIAALR